MDGRGRRRRGRRCPAAGAGPVLRGRLGRPVPVDIETEPVGRNTSGSLRSVASVPLQNSINRAFGTFMLPTSRGVIERMISVLLPSCDCVPNNRPSTGISPNPGIMTLGLGLGVLISPASTWVSPSLSRRTVDVVRVEIG